jgi:hypothetical protein
LIRIGFPTQSTLPGKANDVNPPCPGTQSETPARLNGERRAAVIEHRKELMGLSVGYGLASFRWFEPRSYIAKNDDQSGLTPLTGHCRNFGIRHRAGGVVGLTPLYDVLSAWPVIGRGANQLQIQKAKLAIALGGRVARYFP